jgi:hypothetical protein
MPTGQFVWISLATETLPVLISNRRSQVLDDSKIGLVTPAMYAGLQ